MSLFQGPRDPPAPPLADPVILFILTAPVFTVALYSLADIVSTFFHKGPVQDWLKNWIFLCAWYGPGSVSSVVQSHLRLNFGKTFLPLTKFIADFLFNSFPPLNIRSDICHVVADTHYLPRGIKIICFYLSSSTSCINLFILWSMLTFFLPSVYLSIWCIPSL